MNKNLLSFVFFLFSFWGFSSDLLAQDDLLDLIEDKNPKKEPVTATFKTTRLVTGHSIEMGHGGVFDMKIEHRFGPLNGGVYELFGLDQSNIRFGGDFGITNRISIGAGRSSFGKVYDGFIKVKVLQQKEKGFPITVTALQSVAISSLKWQGPSPYNTFSSRLYYCTQIMIARKFSEGLSIQITPTLVHRNLVASIADQNDVWAIGIGFRQKLTKRVSLNAEYFYLLPGKTADDFYNSLAIGFDIETGGHVFQLQFTNSRQMIEKGFITETDESWLKGGIRFGFNISRVFNVYRWHKDY